MFFDDYLEKSVNIYCFTTHATVRATRTPEIIRLLMGKYSLSEKDALDKFYTSAASAGFADDKTGLYGQSALYVFGVFDEEMREKE